MIGDTEIIGRIRKGDIGQFESLFRFAKGQLHQFAGAGYGAGKDPQLGKFLGIKAIEERPQLLLNQACRRIKYAFKRLLIGEVARTVSIHEIGPSQKFPYEVLRRDLFFNGSGQGLEIGRQKRPHVIGQECIVQIEQESFHGVFTGSGIFGLKMQ